jgi:glutathione S-transferase
MAFLTGDFHPAFFPFFNTQRYTTDVDEDALAGVKEAAEDRVGSYMEFFNAHMEGRDFIVGERRSIADAYAVPMLRWTRLLKKKLDEYPALDDFLARMQADEGVKRALAEQGLK